MKKLSKILALSLALSLTFGMTVLADDSPNPGLQWAQDAAGTGATNAEGEKVEMEVTAPEKAEIETVKADIAKADSKLTSDVKTAAGFSKIKTPELIFVLDIAPADGEEIEGKITVTVPFAGLKAPATGEKYVLMHQEGGSWKAVSGATVTDGKLTFTSSSFSNYALFLVKEDTTQAAAPAPETPAPAPAAPAPAAPAAAEAAPAPAQPLSPKTGETMPVAVFAAMILLAGAAVCAKKEKVNN